MSGFTKREWADASTVDVEVHGDPPLVVRTLQANCSVVTEQIWPVFVPQTSDAAGAAQASWASHWDKATTQTRDTAKWAAVILGTTLVALVGTSPLTGLSGRTGQAFALVIGALVLAAIVASLTLRVLSPSVTSISAVLPAQGRRSFIRRKWKADGDLRKLRHSIEAEAGLQLPLGIEYVSELVKRVKIEEDTVRILAGRVATARAGAQKDAWSTVFSSRSSMYTFLDSQVSQLLTLAVYVRVHSRARTARWAGLLLGIPALVMILLAYTGPFTPPTIGTYELVRASPNLSLLSSVNAARSQIGPNCNTFTGVVVGHDVPPGAALQTHWDQVSVQHGRGCAAGLITIPDDALIRMSA